MKLPVGPRFWAVVSAGLLVWGLSGLDEGGKGVVAQIGVGAFCLLCSLAFLARDHIRSKHARA